MICNCTKLRTPFHSLQSNSCVTRITRAYPVREFRLCRVIEDANSVELPRGSNAVNRVLSPAPELVEYLLELGLNTDEITYSISEGMEYWNRDQSRVRELTVENIDSILMYLVHNDIPVRSLKDIVLCFPALLFASVDEHLEPICQSLKELKIDGLSFAKTISKHPRILLEADSESMQIVIEILKSLGIHESQVHKLIRNNPQLLTQSSRDLKQDIFELSKFFASGEDLVLYMNLCPSIINDSERRYKALWKLLKGISISSEETVRCVQRNPRLLIGDPKKMKGVLDWFISSELSSEELKSILISYPSLLIKSVENLTLKKQFLVKVAKRPFRDILQYPRYFHFSIDRVIGPRFAFLRSRKDPKLQTTSLLLLVSLSNDVFASKIARVLVEEYLVYQAQWTRMYAQKFDSRLKLR